jgi:Probable lipoprotein LpqN
MRRTAAVSGVAAVIAALGIGLVGCGSGSTPSSNKTSSSASTATTAAPTTSAQPQPKVAPRTSVPGPNPTIDSYLQQNGIKATPVHRGDADAPTIDFPMPDGWADAGPDTPPTAYWAIVDNGPEAAKYTPSIVATLSRLEGDPDPQKLLDLAAGETKNLPGFTPHGDGAEGDFAGSPSYQVAGTWVDNGQTKAVAQKTVVINGNDAIYLLRLNADCLPDQIEKALPATITIDDKTKITGTAPSQ